MDQRQECEKSFYRELYHFADKPQVLVMDETTGKLFLRKEMQHYELSVYRFLKEHPHPNIAAVRDFWEEDGKLFVLEEYIDGCTLREKTEHETLPEEEKLRIVKEICAGLSFLHQASPPIVHRDLKASNVMIGQDKSVKLIDYDAAKTVKAYATKDTQLIGTHGSAAPEQYGFAQSDARTDIYALGVLMRELFPGQKDYEAVIEKATKMDPEDRYQSAEEFLRALDKLLVKRDPEARRKRKKRVQWILLSGIGLLGAAYIIWIALRDSGQNALPHSTRETVTDTLTQSTAEQIVRAGSHTFRLPASWERSGNYYYAEKGEHTAFLIVSEQNFDAVLTPDILFLMSDEIQAGVLEGMQEISVSAVSTTQMISVNGTNVFRFSYEGTYGLYDVSGEINYFYDEPAGRLVCVTFSGFVNDEVDYLPQFHAALNTLSAKAQQPEPDYNWIQVYTDKSELVTMNGHFMLHAALLEEDGITIWWLEKDGDYSALFWVGTFEAAGEEDGKAVYRSRKTSASNAFGMSGDQEKTFTLDGQTLSYTIWRGQEVRTIVMKPVE